MDDQNKNLILATVLSFLVIMVWFVMFPPEQPISDPNATVPIAGVPIADAPGVAADAVAQAGIADSRETSLSESVRIEIDTPRLSGSISLLGGRIDDLALKDYRETLDDDSDIVTLLSPVGQPEAYYALFGWAPGGDLNFDDVPGDNTEWTVVEGTVLTQTSPITLQWKNAKGLTFNRKIEVDENFLFSVTQSVENNSAAAVRVAPSIKFVRHGIPSDLKNFFVLHEGAIRQSGEEMK